MERKESIANEATSKETLQDLEEKEESTPENDNADLPSPDGALDEPDELQDADPV